MSRRLPPPELELRDRFVEDYETLRNASGVVRCERDFLHVHGPQALEYLQGQCTQDLVALPVGGTADSLLLEPQGKLDALIRVTKIAEDALVVDVAAGYGAAVVARLERFKLRIKAEIETLPWRCIAIRGKEAPGLSRPSPGTPATEGVGDGSLMIPYSWNGVEGFDIIGEAPEVPAGARDCGDDALEALRVEAGIPEMGSELDDRTIPAEAHLLERCVSFTKGCYTGQELVARLDARGDRVARQLRGLVLGEVVLSGVVGAEIMSVEPGEKGETGEKVAKGETGEKSAKVVGSVTSATWSPALDAVAALGYVHRSLVPPATVELRISRSAVDPAQEPIRVQAELRELPLV